MRAFEGGEGVEGGGGGEGGSVLSHRSSLRLFHSGLGTAT